MPPISSRLLALTLLAVPAIASAQNSPAPDLVPGLDRFDLAPRTQPAPLPSPTPTRAPTPRPTPTPTRAPVARPTATPTPAATRTSTVRAKPTPTPTPTPIAPRTIPTPAPIASATPRAGEGATPATLPAPGNIASTAPTASPAEPAPATAATGLPLWPILLGGLALLAAVAALFYRRRRAAADHFTLDVDEIAAPEPLPPAPPLPDMPAAEDFPPASPRQPAAPPSPAPVFLADAPHAAPRATLELVVRTLRAGTNLTSAAVDYEIDIRNAGERDATDIRLDLRLLSASADQDRVLAALYAAPIERPIVAPFEIAAGEQVSLGGMAMLPRDLLTVMSAQGRDFFVPLLSINLAYGWGDGDTGQTASAYIVGIERDGAGGGGGKMAPFRLDTGPRMHDRVGAREHTLTVRR